jgi:hypothetical protein
MRPWLVLNRFLILTDVGIDTLLRNDLVIIDDVRAPGRPPRGQRGVVRAGVEGFLVRSRVAEAPDGGEQCLGRADHDAAVRGLAPRRAVLSSREFCLTQLRVVLFGIGPASTRYGSPVPTRLQALRRGRPAGAAVPGSDICWRSAVIAAFEVPAQFSRL